ncbi:baseplate J/gp47 family protein [Epibacterium ulvae]|uniref:baseplate J/gp47 family protein n=1 Tax=Epibacterium ulvae TaxID=1156985 RepID=UPI002492F497|nr:baseplate J/gp47 family protein [Epibacterium ulvae]
MTFENHPINILNAEGAPEFVVSDAKALLDQAIGHFESETGRTLGPSQVERYLLHTIAFMFSVWAARTQLALENNTVAYGRDDGLERLGADRETPRLDAQPATTFLQFDAMPDHTGIAIPTGTRVGHTSSNVQFRTADPAFISSTQTQVTVVAEATETGVYSNGLAIGALNVPIDVIPGIAAVMNVTATSGGADRESINRYRARLPGAFERIGNGLTHEHYVDDVFAWNARCVDVDVSRPQPGYVDISPLMDTGAPTEEELASLLSTFGETNIHQGDYIRTLAPISHDFTFTLVLKVQAPEAVELAREKVQTVLDQWSVRLGGHIVLSDLTNAARTIQTVIEADVLGLEFTAIAQNAWRNCTGFDLQVDVI